MPSRVRSRLYHPTTRATVEIAAVAAGGAWVVRTVEQLAGGARVEKTEPGPLTADGSLPSGLTLDQARERVAALAAERRRAGFEPSGQGWKLESLAGKGPASPGAAARALGRIGDERAVAPLIAKVLGGGHEMTEAARALGRLGDERARIALRELAAAPELHRRRAGAEALRLLGDRGGVDEVERRALERIRGRATAVANALDARSAEAPADETLIKEVEAATGAHPDLIDDLYELGTRAATDAVLGWFANEPRLHEQKTSHGYVYARSVRFVQKGYWPAVKSVFKRAVWRRDAPVLARLVYLLERTHGSAGWQHMKYDAPPPVGAPNRKFGRVYSHRTRRHLIRNVWHTLERLARDEPDAFVACATEIILQHGPDDVDTNAFLLYRLTRGAGKWASTRMANLRAIGWTETVEARAELFGALWEASPDAVVRLLREARCVPAHEMAVGVYRDALAAKNPLGALDGADLVAMLAAPFEGTVGLALEELARRFDPKTPDLDLAERLLAHAAAPARDLGRRWLIAAIEAGGAEQRAQILARILAAVRAPEPVEGLHGVLVAIVREHLLEELAATTPLAEVLDTLAEAGAAPVRDLMGEVLDRLPVDPEAVGLARVVTLADDEVASVRRAGRGLIERGLDYYREDPSAVLCLLESEWDDTRAFALELVRDRIDMSRLGIDGLVGLCDANRPEVQALGRELIERHFVELDPGALIDRLSESPHAPMRGFCADLIVGHLAPGAAPLRRLRGYLRRVFLSVNRERATKRRLLAFLLERARADEAQARVVASVLGEMVGSHVGRDREAALRALATIAARWPAVPVPLTLEGPPCS